MSEHADDVSPVFVRPDDAAAREVSLSEAAVMPTTPSSCTAASSSGSFHSVVSSRPTPPRGDVPSLTRLTAVLSRATSEGGCSSNPEAAGNAPHAAVLYHRFVPRMNQETEWTHPPHVVVPRALQTLCTELSQPPYILGNFLELPFVLNSVAERVVLDGPAANGVADAIVDWLFRRGGSVQSQGASPRFPSAAVDAHGLFRIWYRISVERRAGSEGRPSNDGQPVVLVVRYRAECWTLDGQRKFNWRRAWSDAAEGKFGQHRPPQRNEVLAGVGSGPVADSGRMDVEGGAEMVDDLAAVYHTFLDEDEGDDAEEETMRAGPARMSTVGERAAPSPPHSTVLVQFGFNGRPPSDVVDDWATMGANVPGGNPVLRADVSPIVRLVVPAASPEPSVNHPSVAPKTSRPAALFDHVACRLEAIEAAVIEWIAARLLGRRGATLHHRVAARCPAASAAGSELPQLQRVLDELLSLRSPQSAAATSTVPPRSAVTAPQLNLCISPNLRTFKASLFGTLKSGKPQYEDRLLRFLRRGLDSDGPAIIFEPSFVDTAAAAAASSSSSLMMRRPPDTTAPTLLAAGEHRYHLDPALPLRLGGAGEPDRAHGIAGGSHATAGSGSGARAPDPHSPSGYYLKPPLSVAATDSTRSDSPPGGAGSTSSSPSLPAGRETPSMGKSAAAPPPVGGTVVAAEGSFVVVPINASFSREPTAAAIGSLGGGEGPRAPPSSSSAAAAAAAGDVSFLFRVVNTLLLMRPTCDASSPATPRDTLPLKFVPHAREQEIFAAAAFHVFQADNDDSVMALRALLSSSTAKRYPGRLLVLVRMPVHWLVQFVPAGRRESFRKRHPTAPEWTQLFWATVSSASSEAEAVSAACETSFLGRARWWAAHMLLGGGEPNQGSSNSGDMLQPNSSALLTIAAVGHAAWIHALEVSSRAAGQGVTASPGNESQQQFPHRGPHDAVVKSLPPADFLKVPGGFIAVQRYAEDAPLPADMPSQRRPGVDRLRTEILELSHGRCSSKSIEAFVQQDTASLWSLYWRSLIKHFAGDAPMRQFIADRQSDVSSLASTRQSVASGKATMPAVLAPAPLAGHVPVSTAMAVGEQPFGTNLRRLDASRRAATDGGTASTPCCWTVLASPLDAYFATGTEWSLAEASPAMGGRTPHGLSLEPAPSYLSGDNADDSAPRDVEPQHVARAPGLVACHEPAPWPSPTRQLEAAITAARLPRFLRPPGKAGGALNQTVTALLGVPAVALPDVSTKMQL